MSDLPDRKFNHDNHINHVIAPERPAAAPAGGGRRPERDAEPAQAGIFRKLGNWLIKTWPGRVTTTIVALGIAGSVTKGIVDAAGAEKPPTYQVPDQDTGGNEGIDDGDDPVAPDNGVEQPPIPSMEQSQEQLSQQFLIPASTSIEDYPRIFIGELEELANAGANEIDLPVQNWDPEDPIFQQLADKLTAAGNSALFVEGDPGSDNARLATTLYYYAKTSFEGRVYPNNKPYKVSISMIGEPTIVENGDGTYQITVKVQTTDNALQNTTQNNWEAAGDSDGQLRTVGTMTWTVQTVGDYLKASNRSVETIEPNS